ncbi:MAG: translation elongation factor 4 [Parcubacteria group bacterium]
MDKIRNFSIIAHIDHGKSTLADRMLELTGTIDKRHMRDQVLDSMDLERERGITIKMQPVRMEYKGYILNLIDTPGHIDFSYEVSRALRAVEGSILLVDATQGVQAQTLTTLEMAKDSGLKIIPVLSKIDSPLARIDEVKEEIINLLGVKNEDILLVSGKTGEGVEALLGEIIEKVPVTEETKNASLTSLIFDFKYSSHRGVIVFVRVFSGEVKTGDKLRFKVAGKEFQALEVGVFRPEEDKVSSLKAGEIGYIVTGIKEPGIASVGDTVASALDLTPALPGYEKARPVVWASVYPENQDHFTTLKQALYRLRLSDSAFSFEEESSGVLGRGYRVGFLGMLHLEIITERLRREFDLPLVITLPSITYTVVYKTTAGAGQAGKEEVIYTPSFFPEDHIIASVREPWVSGSIIIPPTYIGAVLQLLYEFEAELQDTDNFGEVRTAMKFVMPLRELMRGFFDKLKSVTSGFGSISYSIEGERSADVTRLDILVADESVPAFARVISKRQVEEEAEASVEKLDKILPRQMFTLKIQAKALGRIIASRTKSGMKKDVTQHMYGGDITRKMKLREKQKKGKKKMRERGKVNIPQEVFLKMMRRD